MSERIEVDGAKPADSGRVGDKPAECANGCPPMQVCDFCQDAPVWRAEWAGSAPGRGWYIREGSHLTNAPVVAYLGDNIDKVLVREMVEAHNATVHRDKSLAAQGEPVAWQVRIGSSDIWGGCHSKELADFYGRQSGMRYETRPLYTHPSPAASPAGVPDSVERCMHGCYCGCCQACKNGSCEPVKYTACDCIAAAPFAPESNT